nr:hypothetical protein [Tanacetum cinerariifolium]
ALYGGSGDGYGSLPTDFGVVVGSLTGTSSALGSSTNLSELIGLHIFLTSPPFDLFSGLGSLAGFVALAALSLVTLVALEDSVAPPSTALPLIKASGIDIPTISLPSFLTYLRVFRTLSSCQLDEQWFNIHKDILRDALDITPTNDNNPSVAPPSSDTVIEYVNILGYPSTLRIVSVKLLDSTDQEILCCKFYTMADMNIPANDAPAEQAHAVTPPTKMDDQIFPDALDITPTNDNNPSVAPPSSDTVIEYVNILGYPSTLRNVSTKKSCAANSVRYVRKDGREIVGMSIPDALITDEIKGAPYYGEYQEHVAKYQQHPDAEHGKAVEGGATESSKATKVTKLKAAKATKPASDPKPKPASTQPPKAVLEKKRKLVQETPNEPSPLKRSKGGLVRNICKPMSSLKLVDEPSAEDVPVEKPAYNEEEANLQRALELSLKEQSERTQGPAR